MARTMIDAQFLQALSQRLAVAKITRLNTRQPSPDTGTGLSVFQVGQPFLKRHSSVSHLIDCQRYHDSILKSTICIAPILPPRRPRL